MNCMNMWTAKLLRRLSRKLVQLELDLELLPLLPKDGQVQLGNGQLVAQAAVLHNQDPSVGQTNGADVTLPGCAGPVGKPSEAPNLTGPVPYLGPQRAYPAEEKGLLPLVLPKSHPCGVPDHGDPIGVQEVHQVEPVDELTKVVVSHDVDSQK